MRITNTNAFQTYNALKTNQTFLQKSMQKLSTGLRINSASDDAAGLAISEKMRAQIRGLDQSARNMQDGISLIQTAEGGLTEIHSLLQRGRELSVQAANGTVTNEDKGHIQKEMNEILKEVDNIAENTRFNTKNLLKRGGYVPAPPAPPSGDTGTVITPPTSGTTTPSTGDTGGTTTPSTGDTGGTTTPPPTGDTGTTPSEPVVTDPVETPPPALTDEDKIIEAMKTQYLEQSEKMIFEQYGLKATNSDMKIYIDNANNASIAYVSYYVGSDGKGFNLELHLDKEDFLPADGFNTGKNAPIYNDRIVAHEMVHAVMSQTMNFGALPKWFKEGTAEFIHGADERLDADIYWNGATNVVNAIGNGTDSTWTNASKNYSAGYTAVRYLHERIKSAGGEGIKDVMDYLSQNQSATLDQALRSIPNGSYSGGLNAFVTDFKANGVSFINTKMNLSNSDTGAIGGYDADGGAVKTAENVVADIAHYTEDPLSGFNEIWMNGTNAYAPYAIAAYIGGPATVQENPIRLQTGANSGQTLDVHISDVTTQTLQLFGADVVNNAGGLIDKFDTAISMVSSERSRYGALQNRLEHAISVTTISSENLTQAESRIRDVDMAKETLEFTKRQILSSAAQSMLAQSNQNSQLVLQLLR